MLFSPPFAGLAEAYQHAYPYPEISDPAWVRIGIQRYPVNRPCLFVKWG